MATEQTNTLVGTVRGTTVPKTDSRFEEAPIFWALKSILKSRIKHHLLDGNVVNMFWALFILICLFFIEGYVLYSIVLVSAIHQHESAMGINTQVPSLLKLSPTSYSIPPL